MQHACNNEVTFYSPLHVDLPQCGVVKCSNAHRHHWSFCNWTLSSPSQDEDRLVCCHVTVLPNNSTTLIFAWSFCRKESPTATCCWGSLSRKKELFVAFAMMTMQMVEIAIVSRNVSLVNLIVSWIWGHYPKKMGTLVSFIEWFWLQAKLIWNFIECFDSSNRHCKIQKLIWNHQPDNTQWNTDLPKKKKLVAASDSDWRSCPTKPPSPEESRKQNNWFTGNCNWKKANIDIGNLACSGTTKIGFPRPFHSERLLWLTIYEANCTTTPLTQRRQIKIVMKAGLHLNLLSFPRQKTVCKLLSW